jgi:hypothetical protein
LSTFEKKKKKKKQIGKLFFFFFFRFSDCCVESETRESVQRAARFAGEQDVL